MQACQNCGRGNTAFRAPCAKQIQALEEKLVNLGKGKGLFSCLLLKASTMLQEHVAGRSTSGHTQQILLEEHALNLMYPFPHPTLVHGACEQMASRCLWQRAANEVGRNTSPSSAGQRQGAWPGNRASNLPFSTP